MGPHTYVYVHLWLQLCHWPWLSAIILACVVYLLTLQVRQVLLTRPNCVLTSAYKLVALPWQRVNYDNHLDGILLWEAICACNLVIISFIRSKMYERTIMLYLRSLRTLEGAAYLLSLMQNPAPFYLSSSVISYPSRSSPNSS